MTPKYEKCKYHKSYIRKSGYHLRQGGYPDFPDICPKLVTGKSTPAIGYSLGAPAPRLYPITGGLQPIPGHNQQGRQIELTVISHNQPSSQTEKGSSRMKTRSLHVHSRLHSRYIRLSKNNTHLLRTNQNATRQQDSPSPHYVLQYQDIVQKKNMMNYPKANLADILHSDSSICILLVLKNIIKGKVNLADVLHSDLSIQDSPSHRICFSILVVYIWMNQNATCQQDSASGNSSYSSFEQYQYIYIHVLCTQVSDYIYWVLTTLIQTLLVVAVLLLSLLQAAPPGLLPHQTPSFRQELFFA